MKRKHNTDNKPRVLSLILVLIMLFSTYSFSSSGMIPAQASELENPNNGLPSETEVIEGTTPAPTPAIQAPAATASPDTEIEATPTQVVDTATPPEPTEVPAATTSPDTEIEATPTQVVDTATPPEPSEEPAATTSPDTEIEATPTQVVDTATPPEPTEVPAATTSPDTEIEATPTQVLDTATPPPEDKPLSLQEYIQSAGYAYLLTVDKKSGVYSGYGMSSKKRIGTINGKGTLLLASDYVPRNGKNAAILVWFDTDDGPVSGYVSENRLSTRPMSVAEAMNYISQHGLAIRNIALSNASYTIAKAAYTPQKPEPTATPDVTEPAPTPSESMEPTATPGVTEPVPTPSESMEPTATPDVTEPAPTPSESMEPTATPDVTEPVPTPSESMEPTATPDVTEPVPTPSESMEPTATPDVTEPVPTPSESMEPTVTPDVTEPVPTPSESMEPTVTPEVTVSVPTPMPTLDLSVEPEVTVPVPTPMPTLDLSVEPDPTEATATLVPDQDAEWVLMDDTTGVSVTFRSKALPKSVLPVNIVLQVIPLGRDALAEIHKQIAGKKAAQLIAYDIKLIDITTGKEVQPIGHVGVKLPIPKGFNGKLSVYHLGEGDIEQIDTSNDVSNVFFETDSFSVFALLAEADGEPTTTDVSARVDWVYAVEDTAIATAVEGPVYVYLYRNDVYQGLSVGLQASNGYQYTWADLPLLDGDGIPYTYTVRRSNSNYAPTWIPTFAQDTNGIWVDTETFQETATMVLTIRWSDQNDINGLRPALSMEDLEIKSGMFFTPITASSLTENEDGSYTAVFENVPTTRTSGPSYARLTSYSYKVSGLPGYYTYSVGLLGGNRTTPIMTITLPVHTAKLIDYMYSYLGSGATSAMSWNRAEALGIEVPDSMTMTLMLGDEPVDYAPGASFILTRNADGSWPGLSVDTNKTFYLPRLTEDGVAIDYTGLWVQYTPSLLNNELSGEYTQTFTKTTGVDSFTFILTTLLKTITRITTPVTWVDANDATGLRPIDVTLTLLANGEPVPSAEVFALRATDGMDTPPSSWNYLPQMNEDGLPIHYSVQANGLPAYYEMTVTENPIFDETVGYGTNSLIAVAENLTMTLKTQKVIADVLWVSDGSEYELLNRPLSVILTVLASSDGGTTYEEFEGVSTYAVTRAADGTYHIEWDLPTVDAEGNALLYKVEQNPLTIYTTSYADPVTTVDGEGNQETKLVVTNTYNDAWNYSIDLSWNVTDPTQQYNREDVTLSNSSIEVKYNLTISANDDYDTGMMEIRIPRSLWETRTGDGLVPTSSQISLPQAPLTNPQYSFNYYIDDKGSADTKDDEIVFVNWEPIESGFKQTLAAGYTVVPSNTVDCTIGELTATGSAQSVTQSEPEEQVSNTITYSLDTGVQVNSLTKSTSSSAQGRLYAWDTRYGPQPEDFDMSQYNYVAYTLATRVTNNQPFQIEIAETPDSGGKTVAIRLYSPRAEQLTFIEADEVWRSSIITSPSYNNYPFYLYVVVAYPRVAHEDPLNPGQTTYDDTYQNIATLALVAADEHPGDKEPDDLNDISQKSASITTTWEDYVFIYTGQVYNAYKSVGYLPQDGVTRLQYGIDVTAPGTNFYMYVNGYNLTNGYSMDLIDNAVYAQATIDGVLTPSIPTRLGPDDYEFASNAVVSIRSSDIDRTNGTTIDGLVPSEPFTLWGQRGSDGAWTKIMDITMTQSSSKSYSIPAALLDEQGYTGLRLTSPEGLSGFFHASVSATLKIKASSPLVQSWLASGDVTHINVANIAGYKLYAPSEEGGIYEWINPYSSTTNTYSQYVGLDAEDLVREGAYLFRKNYSRQMGKVVESSTCNKYIASTQNDTVNSKVDVRFGMFVAEVLNSTVLPEEIYMDKSADTGVFYDLLPLGYTYDPASGVSVGGAYYRNMYTSNGKRAVLTGVEVIDDYKGTGRQMLIFSVKSLEPEGMNYYQTASTFTGFRIEFTASISWADLSFAPSGYNIFAYQRGDEESIALGYTEQGYGSNSDPAIFPNDPDGQRVLYDVNGDGDVTEINTLYAYTLVAPDVYTTVQSGISKVVRGYSSYYKQHDIVDVDGTYRYKLRVSTSDGGTTTNLVIYDILENAINIDGATGEIGWKGTFVGVNTLTARNQGIDVKVYYATAALSYNDTAGLQLDSGNWLQTPPGDLSTVKAIAFDLSTGLDGEPFELVNENSVEVEIAMRAPDALQSAEMAYNRPAYMSAFTPSGSSTPISDTIIGSRVTVALRDLQDFSFIKQYETEDEETGEVEYLPLPGVEFRLYQCTDSTEDHVHFGTPGTSSSCWGTTAVRTVTSNDIGEVTFTDLDTGTYAIYETSTQTGYSLLSYRYWVIEVNASTGTVSAPVAWRSTTSTAYPLVEMNWNENSGSYSLTNQRVKKYISVTKAWTEDYAHIIHPPTVTLELYRNGILYRTKVISTPSTSFVVWSFTDLYAYDEYGQTYTYEVREVVPDGYTAFPNPWATFANPGNNGTTVHNVRLGVLDIGKLVANNGDLQKLFTFYVQLKDSTGSPVYPMDGENNPIPFTVRRIAADGTYTEEEAVASSEGILTLQAKHGETLRIIGLPVSTNYTVTEKDESENKYTSAVTAGSATGTTASNVNSNVIFTNTYTPDPATVVLPVQKTITGNTTPTNKEFKFNIAVYDPPQPRPPLPPHPLPSSNELTITGSGTESFNEITYTTAGTYNYVVKEMIGTDAGYIYDTIEHIVIVTVTDNDGVLNATWTVDGESTNPTIAFTNTYAPTPITVALPVSKTIQYVAPPTDKVFNFILTAVDDAPMPVTNTLAITGANDASFNAISYSVPGIYTYTVKETAGTDTGYTYDAAEHTVIVTVTDTNGVLNAAWTVDGETAQSINFTNDYQPLPAEFTLPVRKYIAGAPTVSDETFLFKIDAVTNGAPMPTRTETSVVGEGIGNFDTIRFAATGTYVYTVSENRGTSLGYSYDGEVYTVSVVVADNNGQLVTSWTAKRQDETSAAELLFTNYYSPAPTTVVLPITKTISGNDTPVNKEFKFNIAVYDPPQPRPPLPPHPLPSSNELTILGSGTASFGGITYTTAGTYAYTVKEVAGSDPGYTYDAAEYIVTVTVVDQGGALSATWAATKGSVSSPELLFTNAYAPSPTSIELPVRKALIGNETPADKTFTFTLTAVDGAPMPASGTLSITGANRASFGAIDYSAAGTYTYTLNEVSGNEPGYGYDAAEHTIVVLVTDVNGVLGATWLSDGEMVSEVTFTNVYAPGQASLSLPVQKTITGNDTPSDKLFNFTLEAVDGTPMPSNAENSLSNLTIIGSATSAFGIITYDSAGTYTYKMKEVAGHDTGYSYDVTEHTVVVTVVDNNGTLSAAWTVDGQSADTITFENLYEPEAAMLKLPVHKSIIGSPPLDKIFTFELNATTDAPMPETGENTAQAIGTGDGEFSTIEYTQAGIYEYTVREVAGSETGYTYDDTVYNVIVTVTDINGTLETTYSITTVEGNVDSIEFTNSYTPVPVQLALGANKVLKNKLLTENMFVFTLTNDTGAILQTVDNKASGSVTFEPITYFAPGEYVYTIEEKQGSLYGITYDRTVYTIRIIVTDIDGELVAVEDKAPDAVVFVNTYHSDIPKTGYGETGYPYTYPIGAGIAMLALALLVKTEKKRRT